MSSCGGMGYGCVRAEIVLLLLICCFLVPTSRAESFNCWERSRCQALVGYRPRVPTTLGAIQTLFNVTHVADILAANGLPEWTQPNNFKVEVNRFIRIPFECDCSTGYGYGVPTNPPVYKVRTGDTNISYIITTVFSGLVGLMDIKNGNDVKDFVNLMTGQELRMPLPCSCGQVNGVDVVHFGLTLEYGLTMEQIAEEYHVQPQTIWTLNHATSPDLLLGRALDIPLPVCSSMVRNDSLDYPLLVPNGSYVYTANGCVRCHCDAANNWTLSCVPSNHKPTNWSSCPSMQCSNSTNMYIGNTTYSSSHNLTICAYAGYGSQIILTTLATMSIIPPENAEIRWWISLIVIGGVIIVLIFCYLCCVIWRKCKIEADRKKKMKIIIREIGVSTVASTIYHKTKRHSKDGKANNEMQLFSFSSIVAATDNFSVANKLGEGGFGPVYKGKLPDGQEIAIKRLSSRSGQGLMEFKNEVNLIAKQQHTNLVRLLGFCIQSEEMLLIYEYMPNKSLDFHIFDSNKRETISWEQRFNIIEGIAHGLVYLHHFSRLKVIHRDLKASNILLDYEMNPKISDFGMAILFDFKGIEENTKRIVGTYGYMSPEYAMNGIVSVKTDVFSFGVLLLEIVSGKKNNSLCHSDCHLNLIGLAWKLWNEDKGVELIDPLMPGSCQTDEVLRCIQVGLLCVQDQAVDRPSMLEVATMLINETIPLFAPKQPAYYNDPGANELNVLVGKQKCCSINEVTISTMDAR